MKESLWANPERTEVSCLAFTLLPHSPKPPTMAMAQESELGQTQNRAGTCHGKKGMSRSPFPTELTTSNASQGQENEVGGHTMDFGATDTGI